MTAPAARRTDSKGQSYYPIPGPDGDLHELPSFSRLKGLLYSGGLETWKLKNVAREVARRPDLQMLASDDATVYQAVKESQWATTGAANIGTAFHKWAEQLDAGTLDMAMVPEVGRPYLDHYFVAVDTLNIRTVATEVTVFNLDAGYAGTADKFAMVDGEGPFPVDIKTGKDVWPEVALQLAAYSHAEAMWEAPADGFPEIDDAYRQLERDVADGTNIPAGRRKWSEAAQRQARAEIEERYWGLYAAHPGRRPMPEGIRTDIGYVIHAHPDRCDIVPVRLDGAFDVIRSLCVVFDWQQRRDIVRPPSATVTYTNPAEVPDEPEFDVDGDGQGAAPTRTRIAPLEMTDAEVREWLVDRIRALPTKARQALAERWPADTPTLRSDGHTRAQLDAISEAITGVVREHQIVDDVHPQPFVDTTIQVLATEVFPGAQPVADEASRHAAAARLGCLRDNHPTHFEQVTAAMARLGLLKSLRDTEWLTAELVQLEAVLVSAEKAAVAAATTQQQITNEQEQLTV